MEIRFCRPVKAILGLSLLLVNLFFSFSLRAASGPLSPIDSYLNQHKKFSKKLCRPGTEPKFWNLYRDYKGEGHLVPEVSEGVLDIKAISSNLLTVKEKVIWIEKNIEALKEKKSFGIGKFHIERSAKLLEDLLDYKFEYEKNNSSAIKNKSISALAQLKIEFNGILKELPFLLPFKFPMDLQALRARYDQIKNKKGEEFKKQANALLMYRKVLEDGAQETNRTKNDIFFRTTIHTVFGRLKIENEIISENLRYDLEYVLNTFKHQMKKGKRRLLKRLGEWKKRTLKQHDFYKGIIADKIYYAGRFHGRNEFMKTRKLARKKLKDFVMKGESETYRYWMKRPLMERKIFVAETILFNEVGELDGRLGLERRAITSVILNRVNDPVFSLLGEKDSLGEFLSDIPGKELSRFKWLNVLFKEGEFSFTLFFIPGSIRTFCPDMTRRGRKLRRKNVAMVLEKIRTRPGKLSRDGKTLRYFSRSSMVGRIDMTSIWSDYQRVGEKAGPLLSEQKYYQQLDRAGRLKFLYSFESSTGRNYWVMRFNKKTLVKDVMNSSYFHYRNPHQFSYFNRK